MSEGELFMKRIIKLTFMFMLLCFLSFGLLACGDNDVINSSRTHSLNNVSYQGERYYQFSDEDYYKSLQKASLKLYDILTVDEELDNYVVSPLSIYMALALLDYIGDDTMKEEISTLLDMSESDILKAGELFKHLEIDRGSYKISLTNSIWFDDRDGTLKYNQDVLDNIANDLYCYAHETKFKSNNKGANKDIREFIKKHTNGLIDQDFDISEETLFALINTLYFKDNWFDEGDELDSKEDLFNKGLRELMVTYLYGKYVSGRVYTNDLSNSFYTTTCRGHKLYFILPNEGKTLKDVMTQSNLLNVLNAKIDYTEEEDDKIILHQTRTIFPMFNVDSSTDVKRKLENKYLSHAFSSYQSEIIDLPLYVSGIKHKAVLKVDKKGIEGAAVTIIMNEAASDAPMETVYHDFVVDKSFGYVLTTSEGVILFMGEINNPKK